MYLPQFFYQYVWFSGKCSVCRGIFCTFQDRLVSPPILPILHYQIKIGNPTEPSWEVCQQREGACPILIVFGMLVNSGKCKETIHTSKIVYMKQLLFSGHWKCGAVVAKTFRRELRFWQMPFREGVTTGRLPACVGAWGSCMIGTRERSNDSHGLLVELNVRINSFPGHCCCVLTFTDIFKFWWGDATPERIDAGEQYPQVHR